MIDRTRELPLVRQCQILELSRPAAYYQPAPVSPADRARMRRIDELHLNRPCAGARMLAKMLKREGPPVGRRHVATLMKQMGIHALYRRLRLPVCRDRLHERCKAGLGEILQALQSGQTAHDA